MPTVTTDVSPAIMALAHEARREAIHCIANGRCTPGEIAEHTGRPLGVVSYHVRMLRDYGVIRVERTEPRRGALQHYYGFTDQAVDDLAAVRDIAANAVRGARRGLSR